MISVLIVGVSIFNVKFPFLNSSTVLVTTLPLPPAPPTLQVQSANQNSLKLTWYRKQDKGCTYTLEMKQANEK